MYAGCSFSYNPHTFYLNSFYGALLRSIYQILELAHETSLRLLGSVESKEYRCYDATLLIECREADEGASHLVEGNLPAATKLLP